MITLSLIIPCYNEENNLENLIDIHRKSLSKHLDQNRFEIIFVDDGSTDNTYNIIQEYSKNHKNIFVIKNKKNLGIGYSIDKGFNLAKNNFLMYNSADIPYTYKDFSKILTLLERNDLIIFQRNQRDSNGLWRLLTSYVWNTLSRKLLKLEFKDMNFIQIYNNDVFREINLKFYGPAAYTVGIIFGFKKRNKIINVYSCDFNPRIYDKPKHGKPKDIILAFLSLLNIFFNKKKI